MKKRVEDVCVCVSSGGISDSEPIIKVREESRHGLDSNSDLLTMSLANRTLTMFFNMYKSKIY